MPSTCSISVGVAVGLGGRQVDLVERGDDLEVVLEGQVAVGQRLGLDALGGVDEQDHALARGQRAATPRSRSRRGRACRSGGGRGRCPVEPHVLGLMVMPRSRSRSIESRYCARMSRASTAPVSSSMRSASVDLPWSMWAMIERLRMRSMVAVGGGWALSYDRAIVADNGTLSAPCRRQTGRFSSRCGGRRSRARARPRKPPDVLGHPSGRGDRAAARGCWRCGG